jgi:hypothetical protein
MANRRFREGRWSYSWRMFGAGSTIAIALVPLAGVLLLGRSALKFAILATLCLAIVGIALAGIGLAGRRTAHRLPVLQRDPGLQTGFTVFVITIGAFASLWVAGRVNGPVPSDPAPQPNAAFSLRSTAPDLAALLIELCEPELLDPALAMEMRAAQVPINTESSWGLGVGIQHGAAGDSMWHTGDNPDFNNLLVIYPEQGLGAVVLTNGEGGMPVAYDVVQRALGGEAKWGVSE